MKKTSLIAALLWTAFFLAAAEPLPVQFIRSVRQDQPILYQEELKFFSQLSLHSYVILYELGYVDNLGKWIKPRPKYSPLMELIRMNREVLWGKDIEKISYFTGQTQWFCNGKEGTLLFGALSCVILKSSDGSSRTVVIYRHNTRVNTQIDFPITVNGQDVSAMLGFVDKNGVPELKPDVLEKLKKHLDGLR